MGSVSGRKRGNRYLVSWRLDDGSQGGRTVDTPDEARDLAAQKRLEMRRGTWRGRQRGRLSFNAWATEWWETWAADDPSSTSLASAESRLRLHLRPWFADRPIDKITPADVRRWQAHLDRNVGPPATVAQCRSLALRIFQFAMERERSTPTRSARCPHSSAELTLRRSSARSSVGPSAPRRPGGYWLASRCSGGTTCRPYRPALWGAGRATPAPGPAQAAHSSARGWVHPV
jgi:Phage integrase, N-terminal SAM-like domain